MSDNLAGADQVFNNEIGNRWAGASDSLMMNAGSMLSGPNEITDSAEFKQAQSYAEKGELAMGPLAIFKKGLKQGVKGIIEVSVEASAKETTEQVGKQADDGIIYLRKDQNGEYVGKVKSEKRYEKRQQEHADKNPDAEFEFEELERVPSGSSRPLEVAEEDWIRAGGGPTNKSNPDGALQNKRHEMSEKRYRDNGGEIDQ